MMAGYGSIRAVSSDAPQTGPAWWRWLRRYRTLVAFVLITILALYAGRDVLLPFALGMFVVYILAPAVRWVTAQQIRGDRHIPRWAAVLLVYACLITVIWIFSVTALPQLLDEMARLVREAPQFFQDVRTTWVPAANARLQQLLGKVFPASEGGGPVLDLNVQLAAALQTAAESALAHATGALKLGRTLVTGIVGAFVTTVLTFMIAAFVLIDLDETHGFFRSLVPERHGGNYDDLLVRLDGGLAGVIRGQLLICFVNGCLTFIGLWLIGVPFALILAIVAGTLSLIPIFGTIISTVPAVSIGLTQSFMTGVAVLGWILGIHFIEANFLNPKIIGTSAKIHPAVVVFALLVGEHSFGLVGALLAVPMASMIQTVFLFVRGLDAAGAEDLGSQPS